MNENPDLVLNEVPPPEAPVTDPGTEAVTPTEQEQEVIDYLQLDPRNLQAEVQRLIRENKDFAQVYSRDLGNKAKARYQPEIDRLRQENEALALAIRQREYSALPPEEVNNRFRNDPAFARDYAQTIHAPITAPTTDTTNLIRAQVNNMLNIGVESGLSDAQVAEIQQNIVSGAYDKDILGSQVSITESLANLQQDIIRRLTPVATPTPTSKAPVATRSDTAQPDLTPTGGRGSTREQYTIEAIREMPVEEQFKLIDRLGGMDAAIQNRTIIVQGLNDK